MAQHSDTPDPTSAAAAPLGGSEPTPVATASTGEPYWRPSTDGSTPILDELLTEHGGRL